MANVVEGKFYSFLLNITRFSELVPNPFGINIILTTRYVQIKSDVEMGGKKAVVLSFELESVPPMETFDLIEFPD